MTDQVKRESTKGDRNVQHAFVALVVIFFATIGMLSYYIIQARALSRQGREAKIAICAYKVDLAGRREQTVGALQRAKTYLRDHPTGTHDISLALIMSSIKTQQSLLAGQTQALSSLDVLHCGAKPKEEQ